MKSVLMIGFGNVAFKIGDDNRIQKFSHISVLEQLGIKVTAIIDRQPSPQALLYAKEKNIPIFHNYQSLLENDGSYFDLGVFCLPTIRADISLEILNTMSFGRVLLEKPVSYNPAIAKSIFSRLKETDTRFTINYQRNWDAGYLKVIEWIQKNSVTDAYCRSSTAIAQSGSHMIELILRFFPETEMYYCRPLESKRLIGGEVKEPGAIILFSDKDKQICANFDSSLRNEFIFSGTIFSKTGCLYFDEGEGIIRVTTKQKGNKRIGSEIIYYNDPKILYSWKDEDWLLGCYKDLLSNKNLKPLQDRSLQVVEIINNVMNEVN